MYFDKRQDFFFFPSNITTILPPGGAQVHNWRGQNYMFSNKMCSLPSRVGTIMKMTGKTLQCFQQGDTIIHTILSLLRGVQAIVVCNKLKLRAINAYLCVSCYCSILREHIAKSDPFIGMTLYHWSRHTVQAGSLIGASPIPQRSDQLSQGTAYSPKQNQKTI